MTYRTKETALKKLAAKENFRTKKFELFWNDRDCIKAALQNGQDLIEYFSVDDLKDREIALLACKCSINAYAKVPDDFKKENEFIDANLSHSRIHADLPDSLSNVDFKNPETVKILLGNNPVLLENCPVHVRSNAEYVKLAYRKNSECIRYAHSTLLGKKEFILDVLGLSPEVMRYSPLHDDLEINEAVITKWPAYSHNVLNRLKCDVVWMERMISKNHKVYNYAPLEIREQEHLLNVALDGMFPSDIPHSLLIQKHIALKCLKANHEVFIKLTDEFKDDDEFLEILLNRQWSENDFLRGVRIQDRYSHIIAVRSYSWEKANKVKEQLLPVLLNNRLQRTLGSKEVKKLMKI